MLWSFHCISQGQLKICIVYEKDEQDDHCISFQDNFNSDMVEEATYFKVKQNTPSQNKTQKIGHWKLPK